VSADQPTIVVPPVIVSLLRGLLVEDLLLIGEAARHVVEDTDLESRSQQHRDLVTRAVVRRKLQQMVGWPDAQPATELIIRGQRECTLAIECLTRHRDEEADLLGYLGISPSPPAVRGSVAWPSDDDRSERPERLQALIEFLNENPPPTDTGGATPEPPETTSTTGPED
jgi:hypothetical protein